MKKVEVLSSLIKIFKDYNAVDRYLSDQEIAEKKLNELDIFEHELDLDLRFKREVLLEIILTELTHLNNGIKPTISPCDYTLFDEEITLDEFAGKVAYYS